MYVQLFTLSFGVDISVILFAYIKTFLFTVFLCFCSNLRGHKLLLWFGGIQNLAYEDQVGHLAAIQKSMKPNDRILLTLDLNQEEKIAKNAYLDPKGMLHQIPIYLHITVYWQYKDAYITVLLWLGIMSG